MGFWKCEACKPNHWCKHSGELVPLRCAVNACFYSDWQPAEPDNELAVKQQRIDWCEELQGALRRRIAQLESQPDKLDELAAALERLGRTLCSVVFFVGWNHEPSGLPQGFQIRLNSIDGDVLIKGNQFDASDTINAWCDEHEQTPEQKQAEQDADCIARLREIRSTHWGDYIEYAIKRMESLTGGPK